MPSEKKNRVAPGISRIDTVDSEFVYMRHESGESIDCIEHFYDGEVEVIAGVAKVPAINPHWVSRMRMNGYKEITKE